jgi:demethylmenaquinone methyltransferase/2-methoxy-6-polyprenyl-1,4-benzoquinol methylase
VAVTPVSTGSVSKHPARIAEMFDRIAWRYDRLNHLLSAGLDRRWRRRGVAALGLTGRERVLDVCTGTGDLAIEAVTARPGARDVIGIDFAAEMLRMAQQKQRARGLAPRLRLARGDATRLPLPDASMDAAMIAFGIRNVVDPEGACAEIRRVLRPGGRLMILEFGNPRVPLIRTCYRLYFTVVLPIVGRIFSKHQEAYRYLPASVQQFPAGEAFAAVLERAGLDVVTVDSWTLGVVYLYVARRRPA